MNNVMVTKFNGGFIFSEVVGQRKRLFEALGVPVPTVIQSKEQELEEELCTELDEINSVDELMCRLSWSWSEIIKADDLELDDLFNFRYLKV